MLRLTDLKRAVGFWLSPIPASLAIFAAAVGSLLTAYVAEHFFDVLPCTLCLYQRVPYAIVAFLAVLAYALCVRGKGGGARVVLALCAAAFFTNMGIAFFHSGVELHWWAGTDGCAVNPLVLADPVAAREALLNTKAVRCDEINFTFLSFTMANWNVLASLGLGVFAALASAGAGRFLAKPKA